MYEPRSANPDGSGPYLLSAVLTGNVHLAGVLFMIDIITENDGAMNRKKSQQADEPIPAIPIFKHVYPDRPYLGGKVMQGRRKEGPSYSQVH